MVQLKGISERVGDDFIREELSKIAKSLESSAPKSEADVFRLIISGVLAGVGIIILLMFAFFYLNREKVAIEEVLKYGQAIIQESSQDLIGLSSPAENEFKKFVQLLNNLKMQKVMLAKKLDAAARSVSKTFTEIKHKYRRNGGCFS